MKYAKYSATLRSKAVKMHQDGKTVGEVAKELGIKTASQIYKWARKSKDKNKAAPLPTIGLAQAVLSTTDISAMFKDQNASNELQKLRTENAMLKNKLLALQDVYLQQMGVYKL
jgi:transposase-like protein